MTETLSLFDLPTEEPAHVQAAPAVKAANASGSTAPVAAEADSASCGTPAGPSAVWLKDALAAGYSSRMKLLAAMPEPAKLEVGAAMWAYALARDTALQQQHSALHAQARLSGHANLDDALQRVCRTLMRHGVPTGDIPLAHPGMASAQAAPDEDACSEQLRERPGGG